MKKFFITAFSIATFLGSFLFISLHPASDVGVRTEVESQRSGALEALEFWTRARAYPATDLPGDKYYKAFERMRGTMKSDRNDYDAATHWESMGPSNLGGRMISVACNPLNGNTIYAGSAAGGLWKSRTGGVAGDWERIAIGYPVLGVGAIAIHPSDSNVMYIGTGETYRYQGAAGGLVIRTTRGSYGMGVLKTTDGGATWSKSLDWSYHNQRGVQMLRMNPLNPNTIYAATTESVYKSMDAGASWTSIGPATMAQDLLIHPTDTNLVLCSSGNFKFGAGIWRSEDGGTSWTELSPTAFSGKTLLAMNGQNPNTVYADICDSTTGVGNIWKSINFGLSWSVFAASPGIYGVQGWYSHFIAVNPLDSNKIFHGAVSSRVTTNGGATWSGPSGGPYSDNHAFAYDPANPNILYTANDDGIERSTDFGQSWVDVDNNLQTGQFYNGFSNSMTDSNLAIVQSQDHIPGYKYTGSTAWGRSAVDEAGWTAIDPTNDNLMYAVNRFGGSVSRSTNRGISFGSSVSLSTTGAWNTPIVISPSNTSILYVGKTKVFKSTNAGVSYTVTNANLTLDNNTILGMGISSTNSDTVYACTAPSVNTAHVFRTTNGGTSWTDVTGTLPNRYMLDLAVDPGNSRIVYVGLGGFGTGHIFKSTNAGGSWTDISGILPDIPVTAILVDPLYTNVVYAGTDLSVFVSTNGGISWNAFGDGLPDAVLVSDLTMTSSNRSIRVSTHGNGAYQRKMPGTFPALTLVSPSGGEAWEAGSSHTISWTQTIIPAVKLEYTTDDGASWITIADNLPGYPDSYQWTPLKTLTSLARVRVTSTSDTTLRDQSNALFTIYFGGNIVGYRSGWNMVSLPTTTADTRATSLFPTAVSSLFEFSGSYVTAESLNHGTGYWIKLPSTQTVSLPGSGVTDDTVDVVNGWNLVGSLGSTISVASIGSIPGGLVTSEFFGYGGSYMQTDSIQPGSGYWVKVSGAGQLILSASASIIPSQRIRITPTSERPPSAPADDIADSDPAAPTAFALHQNYPNPFNPTTVLRFSIVDFGFVTLKVFDMLGKEVATLVHEAKGPGEYAASWDVPQSGIPSGIYIYQLTAGTSTQSRKMVLMK